jgi:nucleoside-diphosphate-sugar epimerase
MTDGPRFDGRKIAVTGAGGFIGNAVCGALATEGAEVRGLELNTLAADRVAASGAGFEACDVTDPGALERCLQGVDLAVHTAAHVR